MDCPKCGETCFQMVTGQDQFGQIRIYYCPNELCMWREDDDEEVEGGESAKAPAEPECRED